MKPSFKRISLGLLALFSAAAGAEASGILIPRDESIRPLAIKHQRVSIEIENGVANVTIEQVFRNHTDRDLEAVYVFPLPDGAAIDDFAMMIGGERMSGELVEKERARQIYQNIVRRLQDPGLLEYLGGNLFRMSVFPVPRGGDQKIELVYSQTLAFESGLYRLVYPLKTADRASRTLMDFTISARLKSDIPIGNVYSPSHPVEIVRRSDREVVLGFEEDRWVLDRDFEMFYSVSRDDLDINLLTHAVPEQDGYFMLMLTPGIVAADGEPIPKDVVFALDTSGSMRGEKIEQARRALTYAVERLNPHDRFTIIRFSTDVDPMSDRLLTVDDETKRKALDYVSRTTARGGTAIDEALATALKMDFDPDHSAIVVFLTDGKPTIGESTPDIILRNVGERNQRGARLFVFGVGDEVNTLLLDRLSIEHGGISQYVRPDEDIEIRLSAFVDKISDPVLSDPRIEIDGLKVTQTMPRSLPDLFGGERILVFGRYQGGGHVAIRLLGKVNGIPREFVYEGTFPEEQSANLFIPRLWATRRIGFLIEQIRLHGESGELKDEVILLSREYGVMTPYTSFLVLEDEKAYQRHGLRERADVRPSEVFAARSAAFSRRPAGGAVAADHGVIGGAAMLPMFDAADAPAFHGLATAERPRSAPPPRLLQESPSRIDGYLRRESGAEAVDLSQTLRAYQDHTATGRDIDGVRHVNRRTFYQIGDRWVDQRFRAGIPARRIVFGDDAYFALLDEYPGLKAYLALGARVTLVLDDNTALIVELKE